MTFLASEVLIGLLTALIPLVLHLLFRKKPQVVRLPTLRFVRLANRKVLKRHRLKRRLLLLVRMLLLGLAAFAMSRPLLQETSELSTLSQFEDLVVVVDNSYFSNAEFEGERVLDHVRRDAASLLDSASGATGVVLTCGAKSNKNVSLSADQNSAKTALSLAEPKRELCDLELAVSKANQLLLDPAQSQSAGTIMVISTAERLERLQDKNSSNESVTLKKIDMFTGRPIDNTAITDLSVRAAPELGDNFWQVDATVAHFGAKDRTADITLSLKPDVEIVATINLKPGLTVQKSFQFSTKLPAPTRGQLAMDSDKLDYDDKVHFWMIPTSKIKVLAINGELSAQPQEDELFYFETAVADSTTQSNEFDLKTVSLDGWSSRQWNQPDVVLLANPGALPSPLAAQLATFVQDGGGVILTLGDQVDVSSINRQLGGILPRRIRGLRRAGDAAASDQGQDRKPAKIDGFSHEHKALEQIPSPNETSISQARVSNYALFSTEVTQDVDEVIRLDEGAPLLIAGQKGSGRVVVLSTTIDREWTDLPIQPDFVPLTIGMLRYAAKQTPKVAQTLKQGSRLKLSYPEDEGLSFRLTSPDGNTAVVNVTDVQDRLRILDDLDQIGHYVAVNETSTEQRQHHFSVMPNTLASNLHRPMVKTEKTTASNEESVANASNTELWPFALLILFGLLGLESQMAYGIKQGES